MKIAYTRTYGCRGNVSDGEKLNGMLAEMGYGFALTPENADLILLNTCAVRENAENKVFGNVGALIHQKRRNPDLIIAVCGCMVQQESVAKKLYETYPFVDLIFGTHALPRFPELLTRVLTDKKRVLDLEASNGVITEGVPVMRSDKFKADVPIAYGCDNFCSYCVVPYVRGRERSREPEIVIGEVRGLIESGYKEIMLLGQNVDSYGRNLKNHSFNFAKLLQELDKINGEFVISYMTSHPKDLTKELIDVIANSAKVSRHLHLPIQSGSDRILKLMNRGYTVEKYADIVNYARKKIPEISLTTDIIVGFPGETREDFDATLKVIRELKFDSAYTFIYSRRAGTKAANFDDETTSEEKSARFQEMLDVLAEVGDKAYERYVGKTLRVLCEGEGRTGVKLDNCDDGNKRMFTGKSKEGIIVDFEADADSELIGEFIDVKVVKALKWAVAGRVDNHSNL